MSTHSAPPSANGQAPAPPAPSPLLAGLPGTLLALATAVGGIITTYQSYQDSQAVSRASYEQLKMAIERNTEADRARGQGQAELRLWVQELAERVDRRQTTTEKALVAKRVIKPPQLQAPPVVVIPPPEPQSPLQPMPQSQPPAELPPFDSLASR